MTRADDGQSWGVSDRGLQQERTSLAWERTGLALIVASLLGFRFLQRHGLWLPAVAALPFALAGSGIIVRAQRQYMALHRTMREAGNVADPRFVRLLGIAVTVFCGSALVAAGAWAILLAAA